MITSIHRDVVQYSTLRTEEAIAAQNVTVIGDRNRAMITELFVSQLNNHHGGARAAVSTRDGTTCHTAIVPQLIY